MSGAIKENLWSDCRSGDSDSNWSSDLTTVGFGKFIYSNCDFHMTTKNLFCFESERWFRGLIEKRCKRPVELSRVVVDLFRARGWKMILASMKNVFHHTKDNVADKWFIFSWTCLVIFFLSCRRIFGKVFRHARRIRIAIQFARLARQSSDLNYSLFIYPTSRDFVSEVINVSGVPRQIRSQSSVQFHFLNQTEAKR